MINQNTEGDSWGQLLSDFGIKDTQQEETPQQEEPATLPEPVTPEPIGADDFGSGIADFEAEGTAEEPAGSATESAEKKSIFSRFPKINFFGAPPEVSLDAVIEVSKSPSLDGKAFTSKTLEKMPVSQERKERKKRDRSGKDAAEVPSALVAVASQIDALVSVGKVEERSGRRAVASIFDDPVPESDEIRALKDLMGEQPHREAIPRETFQHEKETDSRPHGRGRRKPLAEERYPEESEVRGRGTRYRPPVEVDDLPESDFQMMDDDVPETRGRGRRGSRYSGGEHREREPIQNDVPQEEWSEVDVALQAGRGAPAPRGGRQQRYDKRRKPDRIEERPAEREHWEDEDRIVVSVHGDVPSWGEAIGDIIAGNIARRRTNSGRGRR